MKIRPLILALVLMCASVGVPLSANAVTLTSDLSIGSRGAEVTQLQLTLFQFGYSTAAPSGVFSETTAAGVRALQKKYGLEQTGTVGAGTRAILNPFIARNPTAGASRPASVAPVATYTPTTAPLGVGARGAAVLEVQQKLLVLGFFGDTPTGYFGPITRAAVAAFQAAKGLEQVGFVGPRTRALLATVSTTAPSSSGSTSTDLGTTTGSSEDSPSLSFRVNKRSAPAGDTIRLTWSAKDATTCTAGNGWSGEKSASGSESLTFSADSTYALVCAGAGGSVSKSVSVKISATAEEAEEEIDAPTLTFSADKTTVASGGSVKLSWRATDADSCTATGDWSGQKDGRDTETIANITSAKTFTLSCVGAGGSITRSVPVSLEAVVTPTPTPTPTPLPTPLPGPSKSYEVYAGCEAPAQSYARVIYIDPRGGSDTGDGSAAAPLRTLAAAFTAKKLRAGDHIVLMPGDHGAVTTDSKYEQKGFFYPDAANWTWFDFQEGATVGNLELRSFSRVLVTNPEVTPGGIMMSSGTQFVVADGEFYLSKNTSNWSAADWLGKGKGAALASRNARCVSFIDNDFENVAFGINTSADGLPITDNSVYALIARNTISRFSGDGIRPNGSDVFVKDNRIIDAMVGAEDGDGNHDDGIQIFALNGHEHKNVRIENNWVQETTDMSRPLIGHMQGISNFDGLLRNITVRNNVVLITVYHGMNFVADGGVVENNTIVNIGDSTRNTWISLDDVGKKGEIGKNVILRNNIARVFIYPASDGSRTVVRYPNSDTARNNLTIMGNEADVFTTFNPANGQFDLRPKSGGLLEGKGAGASGLSSGLGSVAGASLGVPALDELMRQLEILLRSLK
ncbi:MAG: peptidoglycan-binding protein [Patescibacteria group bacterium]